MNTEINIDPISNSGKPNNSNKLICNKKRENKEQKKEDPPKYEEYDNDPLYDPTTHCYICGINMGPYSSSQYCSRRCLYG
jgi:hypothetical protein